MICTLQYLGEGVLMFAVDLEMHQKARQLESPLLPPEVQMDPLAVTPSAGSCIPPAPHLPPPISQDEEMGEQVHVGQRGGLKPVSLPKQKEPCLHSQQMSQACRSPRLPLDQG